MSDNGKLKKKTSNYTNANNLLGYNIQMQQWYANQINDENIASLKDQIAIDTYNRDVDLQQLQFQQQLDVFDRSEQAFHQNIGLVDEAIKLAYAQENLLLDQKLMELAYSKEDLDRGWLQTQVESQFAMQQLELKDDTDEANFAANMQAASIEQKQRASDAKYEFLQASLKGDAAAGQAKATGRRGNTARKTTNSAVMQASMDKGKIASDLYNGSLSFKNTTSNLSKQRELGVKGFDQNKTNIETMLGISAEEYASSTSQLGQMLKDQFKQSEYNMAKIELKGFNTKSELYSNRMLPPLKPPPIPKPYETPRTNYVKPLPPVHADKGLSGGYSGASAGGQSTASTILGFGQAGLGAAAGIVGATGGAAAPFLAAGAAVSGLLSSLF